MSDRPAMSWTEFWRTIRVSGREGALLGNCSHCRGSLTVRVLMVLPELVVKCHCGASTWRFRLVAEDPAEMGRA